MTGGTFTGHGAVCGFEFPEKLVKNADENGPTAAGALPEVITVRPAWNRDDSRESPTE
ncbi:hypothetical protein [Streptomyces lincolnensis]|uniref:hypothetical protein n=1 Tax=Streptomyces TaxID=1883 RepID=UPI001E5DC4F4|nr:MULTISPECIES: hypothetical protein [Streptomyces]MCD7442894.1 hypothetical protein [Streptomyces lincolnensis]WLW56606.1 hypothetical protein QU709_36955 [Streptomyces coralus]